MLLSSNYPMCGYPVLEEAFIGIVWMPILASQILLQEFSAQKLGCLNLSKTSNRLNAGWGQSIRT